jgi:hypothetical protein
MMDSEKGPNGIPRRKLEINIKVEREKYGVKVWTGFTWLKTETTSRKRSIKLSASTKRGKFCH